MPVNSSILVADGLRSASHRCRSRAVELPFHSIGGGFSRDAVFWAAGPIALGFDASILIICIIKRRRLECLPMSSNDFHTNDIHFHK